MAIESKRMQQRSGTYGQFLAHKSEFLPNEFEIVTSGDPNTSGGKSVYFSFNPNDTKRLMTAEDAAEDIAKATEEATAAANNAAESAQDSADQAKNYYDQIPARAEESKQEIADYTEAMKQTIPEDYTALSDLVNELDKTRAPGITLSASGEQVILSDASNQRLIDLELTGKTTQDGESSLESPVDIVNTQPPVQVEVMGGNFFPDFIENKTYANGSTVNVNQDGSITVHKVVGDLINIQKTYHLKSGNYTLSSGLDSGSYVYVQVGSNLYTSDIASKSGYLSGGEYKFILYSESGKSSDVTIYPMLNIGETPLPYEKYKQPQTVTITSDRPITKWDKLIKQNGVWGWLYQTAYIESYNGEAITGEWQSTTGELITGASVQYKTSPEFVPLSDEEQQLMNSLHTNNPTTIVTTTPQMGIKIDYTADTKTYVDNKIAEAVTQAITIAKA